MSASKTIGYQAFETLAGTRIRTNLADVGASISVITPEFLQDISATDNGSLLEYTPNAQVASPQGYYAGVGNGTSADELPLLQNPNLANRIRGLAAADNARDFYITDIPWDSYNVDRVSILRGPNSILYGLGSPAGIVNASLKKAEFDNHGSVTERTGSYGSNRATIDINRQIIPNVLAVRVDGLWDDRKYEQKAAFQNDKRVYGSLRFDPQLFRNPGFQTDINVKWEHGEVNGDAERLVPPNDGVTAWFRPTQVSASNPFGGMGRTLVNNPYDPYRTDNVVAGNGFGMANQTTVNYQPWLNDNANQQQPFWLIDGTTNQLFGIDGGYINLGARDSNGNFVSGSDSIPGKRQNGMFYGLGTLPSVVNRYNNMAADTFPLAKYGQYKTQSLLDPSVFDFYHNLIDGPTKFEFQKWNAYNLDFSQTAFDNRLALELTYDRQKYERGGQALLGGSPTLSIDILKNELDYYVSGADGTTSVTNPNLGRPFVVGAGSGGTGTGNSYYSDREYRRASLFGELRATDFTSNSFLDKLLGKHRFNAVASDEKYYTEKRSWDMYANSAAWDNYWSGSSVSNSFSNRPPLAFIYLGSSIINRASASGANIPGISTNITLPSGGVYVMDPTWQNYNTTFATPWNVPSGLSSVFNGIPDAGSTTQLTQVSNPDNLTGWNSNFQDTLLRYNNGQDQSLTTLAEKSLRETLSYSGSYQGFFWNNALVATLGWRFDSVKTKDVTAAPYPLDRGILDLQPDVYNLNGGYPHSQIFKGHSTSGGAVLHINRLFKHDPLPINISLSYNESSNFQVTSVRRDVYGNTIGNPTGKTYEYGLMLSTKDNKYGLRVTKYKTEVNNGASTLSSAGTLGYIVQQGMRWRNVFLYQLGVYSWNTRNQDSYRNRWTNAYPNETDAQAIAEENASITAWNNIQTYLTGKGFFKAWGFTPTTPSVLTDRTTYLSDPAKYAPDPATVAQYQAFEPQGFTVTSDTTSKGYEYEFIANPLPNWRIEINASETTAVQNNVGGAALTDFVNYMTNQLYQNGAQTPAGLLPQYGGASNSMYLSIWSPFLANYTLLKLQEGADVPEIRKWHYNVITNYQFTHGHLKGFGVGGAYRFQSKVAIGYPVNSNGQFELNNPYWGPSQDSIDLWASYQRQLSNKIHWRIQLNIRNAFAKNGLIPVSIEPDGKTWATVRIKPIQEWYLTNTFSF